VREFLEADDVTFPRRANAHVTEIAALLANVGNLDDTAHLDLARREAFLAAGPGQGKQTFLVQTRELQSIPQNLTSELIVLQRV
jgi:recombinational DNA repair ATPase RecF